MHAFGDEREVLGAFLRHQVEDGADVLGGGGDVVQLGAAGVGDLDLQAEALAHGIEGDLVNGVHRLQRLERGQGGACGLDLGGGAGGGVVGVCGFAARQAKRRGEFGGELEELLEVVGGYGCRSRWVCAWLWCSSCHQPMRL